MILIADMHPVFYVTVKDYPFPAELLVSFAIV